MRDSVLVQRYMFGDRQRIARVIAGAPRAPRLTRALVDCAAGRLDYRALRRTRIFNAPGFAARLAWSWLRMNLLSRPSADQYDLSAQGG